MNPIEWFLGIIAGVMVVVAIVIIEMIAVAIAEAILKDKDETTTNN